MLSLFAQQPMPTFQSLFDEHATTKNDVKILNKDQFKAAMLPASELFPFTDAQSNALFVAADVHKKGALDLSDFLEFEKVLASPDAEYQIVSRLIHNGNDELTADQVAQFFQSQNHNPRIDFKSDAVRLSIGSGKHVVSYNSLTEFLKIVRIESQKAYFKQHDRSNSGFIHSCCAYPLLLSGTGHSSESVIAKNLRAATETIDFNEYVALSNVISKLDHIKHIVTIAHETNDTIDAATFASTASKYLAYDSFTPLEVSMLFKLLGPQQSHPMTSFTTLLNPSYDPSLAANAAPVQLSAGMELLRGLYNFSLGSVAGAIGAAAVYPIGNLSFVD